MAKLHLGKFVDVDIF